MTTIPLLDPEKVESLILTWMGDMTQQHGDRTIKDMFDSATIQSWILGDIMQFAQAEDAPQALSAAIEARADLVEVAKERDELLLALYALLRAAHPMYSSTATWHGGVGGQALTQGCSVKDPPPWHEEGVRRVKETLLKSMNKLDEPRMDRLDKAAHAMFPRQ